MRPLVLPFGLEEIDSRLPQGGLVLGALHELAGGGPGAVHGAAAALFAAGILARLKGPEPHDVRFPGTRIGHPPCLAAHCRPNNRKACLFPDRPART
jgi:hypothetical protein